MKINIKGHELEARSGQFLNNANRHVDCVRLYDNDIEVAWGETLEEAKRNAEKVLQPVQNNSVINSLKRLERAGLEHSKANQKLKAAARAVAVRIIELTPEELLTQDDSYSRTSHDALTLPRGYVVEKYVGQGNAYGDMYLTRAGEMQGRDRSFERADKYEATSAEALQFAADIAAGLLDEIAVWLEARTAENEKAARELEYAANRTDNTAGLPPVVGE